jgi:hypothetical protein
MIATLALGLLSACTSASAHRAQLAAKCQRDLDSAIARMDRSAHFPSQVRVDSSVKAGEVDGVVVSALTHDSLGSAMVFVHSADNSGHDGQVADHEGRFHIASRAPGRIELVAQLLGYKRDSVMIDSDAGTSVIIALRVNPLRISGACCYPPPGSICL